VLKARKNEQCHDDASKEVTTPAGVAVIHITLGFYPALLASTDVPMSRSSLSFAAPRHGEVAHPPTSPRRQATVSPTSQPSGEKHRCQMRASPRRRHHHQGFARRLLWRREGEHTGEARGRQRISPPMLPRLSDALVRFVIHDRFLP
jgi:hypothetical protein